MKAMKYRTGMPPQYVKVISICIMKFVYRVDPSTYGPVYSDSKSSCST